MAACHFPPKSRYFPRNKIMFTSTCFQTTQEPYIYSKSEQKSGLKYEAEDYQAEVGSIVSKP
jgi:hypothetical protein